MKRLLTAFAFLALMLLIWWLWNRDQNKTPVISSDIIASEGIVSDTKATPKKPKLKFKPQKRQLKVPITQKNIDVEVKSDKNGVVITSLGGKELHKVVTKNPVDRLTVKGSAMTFFEVDPQTGQLTFKSINLEALLASELKQ